MVVDTPRGPQDAPAPAEELLSSVRERLDQFSEGLTDAERRALAVLLRQMPQSSALLALAAEPAAQLLEPQEREIWKCLVASPAPAAPSAQPFLGLIMKATRVCNLRCTYCRSWGEGPGEVMTFEVLARSIFGALTAAGAGTVEFIWHGGEPTLRPLSFYRKALWLQQQCRRPGQKIVNNLQTNGTLLRPEWIEFLTRYRFRVGVSLDGPPEIHDRRRLDVAGRPTSLRVRAGLKQLQEHGIHHGVCMVVDDDVIALGPRRLLDYLLELGVREVGLLSVVPQGDPRQASSADPYLLFPRYIEFLRGLFRLWWPAHTGRISFREIADLMAKLEGRKAGYCYFSGSCMGSFLTIEPAGQVAACDKFQGDDDYRLGNLLEASLAEILASAELGRIAADTRTHAEESRSCSWFELCQAGCPHDRLVRARRDVSKGEACCGWGPLISDMAAAVGHVPTPSTGSERHTLFEQQ